LLIAVSTGSASYSRQVNLIKTAISVVAVFLAYIVRPFVVAGVFIKILNDPRKIYVLQEDRAYDVLNDPRDTHVLGENRTLDTLDDPRVIYIKSKE
jgi:hypothetical protein